MLYTKKSSSDKSLKVIADDMLLTVDMPTTAGSKMLEGYNSLIESQALKSLKEAGYGLVGKANVGEFAIDLLGETSYFGAVYKDGVLKNPSAEILLSDEADLAIGLDVNGSILRAAGQNDLCAVKATYGKVSRYGTIPVACSGETVCLTSKNIDALIKAIDVISGYDAKDGTSIPKQMEDELKQNVTKKNKVALVTNMLDGVDDTVNAKIKDAIDTLTANGVQVDKIEIKELSYARSAWNILMSAELCNNVSRYDGVKYGYRSNNFTNLDELYVNSRTEAFGELLKSVILFGSECLSTDNYMKVYDKALRVRRVIVDAFAKAFTDYDALLMPVCSTLEYTKEMVESDKYLSLTENFYTAPASITGLPAVVNCGVQFVGKAFAEQLLFELASACCKGE